MARNTSRGVVQIAALSLFEVNRTLQELSTRLDTLEGLRGPVSIADAVAVTQPLDVTPVPVAPESLELTGGLKLGDALGTEEGTLRWTGTDFEGRKNGAWASLTVDAAALGLGTMAVQNADAVAITGGALNGMTSVQVADSATADVKGLRSSVVTGAAGRYNLYCDGTAPNYMAGPLSVNGLPLAFTHEVIYLDTGAHGLTVHHKAADTGGGLPLAFKNLAGTLIGSVSSNASGVAYNTTSDIRLKHAIVELSGALDVVAALRPVRFRWTADDSADEGFLAHELQLIIPRAVVGEPDAVNRDGSMRPQQVAFSKLVPWLVAAIKELRLRVQALEGGS